MDLLLNLYQFEKLSSHRLPECSLFSLTPHVCAHKFMILPPHEGILIPYISATFYARSSLIEIFAFCSKLLIFLSKHKLYSLNVPPHIPQLTETTNLCKLFSNPLLTPSHEFNDCKVTKRLKIL